MRVEGDVEIGVGFLEGFEFLAEDDVGFGFVGVEEVDVAGPVGGGEVAEDGHEGCDANAGGTRRAMDWEASPLKVKEPLGAVRVRRWPSLMESCMWREAVPERGRV